MLSPVPAWVAPVFAACAFMLVPWIGYLAATLPHTERVYARVPWVGFDIGLMIALTTTAILAWRGSARVALVATATATMLTIDAWFDVTGSVRDDERSRALASAVGELILAAVCLWIAHHATEVVRTHIRDLVRKRRRK
jgi:hypothetical protein